MLHFPREARFEGGPARHSQREWRVRRWVGASRFAGCDGVTGRKGPSLIETGLRRELEAGRDETGETTASARLRSLRKLRERSRREPKGPAQDGGSDVASSATTGHGDAASPPRKRRRRTGSGKGSDSRHASGDARSGEPSVETQLAASPRQTAGLQTWPAAQYRMRPHATNCGSPALHRIGGNASFGAI